MTRPTRQTTAGRAYLDLQNRARREQRGHSRRALARNLAADELAVAARVAEIAALGDSDAGVEFASETATNGGYP